MICKTVEMIALKENLISVSKLSTGYDAKTIFKTPAEKFGGIHFLLVLHQRFLRIWDRHVPSVCAFKMWENYLGNYIWGTKELLANLLPLIFWETLQI